MNRSLKRSSIWIRNGGKALGRIDLR
jgi:hypothetical protein